MATNPDLINGAAEHIRTQENPKLPQSMRLLLTTAISLTLWYALIQGSVFGYGLMQGKLQEADDPGASSAAKPPALSVSAAKPSTLSVSAARRPDGAELVRDYTRRLAAINMTVAAPVASTGVSPATTALSSAVAAANPSVGSTDTPPAAPSTTQANDDVRDVVLEMLRDFGLVSSNSGASLSNEELDRIVGGQGAPGMAAAAAPAPEDETDPTLDALNRVLVEGGGLLLSPWTVELQPESRYSYKGANGLLIREQNGQRSVVAHSADLTKLEAALTARMGLPWQSQVEVRVPYVRVSEESSVGTNSTSSSSEHGLGDIEIGLSHQLLREKGWIPDLIGEVRYRAPTGDDGFGGDDNSLPVGSGFHGITGRLTAVKSLDPVVVLGSIGYTANLEDTKEGFDIDPGDSIEFGISAILAAGPGVSLRTGFGLSFTGEAEVNNDKISGSDKTEGVLNLGGAVVLPGKNLLDLGVGVGVTDDAPDVAVRLALTHRF